MFPKQARAPQGKSIKDINLPKDNLQTPSNSKMYPTRIDLFKGQPAISMLPVNRLKQASSVALSDETIFGTGLEYGPNEGHLPMRKNMAEWLTRFYNPSQPIPTDRVCITGGASQNLACILQVFTDPAQTKKIWLVEPTYHLGFRIFEDAGFMGRLRGIPEDEDGLDVAALERALEAFEQEHPTQNDTVCIYSAFWCRCSNTYTHPRYTRLKDHMGRYTNMLYIVFRHFRIPQERQCLGPDESILFGLHASSMLSSWQMMYMISLPGPMRIPGIRVSHVSWT